MNEFLARHLGSSPKDLTEMAEVVGFDGIESLIDAVVPKDIRSSSPLKLSSFPAEKTEVGALDELRAIMAKNEVRRSFIGLGYYGCHVPPVIQRNILENPAWYTAYTPYQAEISQGRMEALFNYQTLVASLTGLPYANASLLDEGSSAAEAMTMLLAEHRKNAADGAGQVFFVDADIHPQTLAVVRTRAEALGVSLQVGDSSSASFAPGCFGCLLQYPGSSGRVWDPSEVIQRAHAGGTLVALASDLLALLLLRSPGQLGADIAFGSAQRFGVPMGFGGPHAAFFAVRDDLKRLMPGRLVGLSRDAQGNPAFRLSLQTREQHIRREKATSNICTAQVLLAVMASMYATYHGGEGLKRIAASVHSRALRLAAMAQSGGLELVHPQFFDTLSFRGSREQIQGIRKRAEEQGFNFHFTSETAFQLSLDETVDEALLLKLGAALCGSMPRHCGNPRGGVIPASLERGEDPLPHPVFRKYTTETEFLRFLKRLESKDLSLANAMIPLGSCTMKLNATSEMLPLSWPEVANLHPFVDAEQSCGYQQLIQDLETSLAEITGFAAVSLQPNSGAQGEYAGLLAIRAYLQSKGEHERRICLIPRSAHGTNPASAVVSGFQVIVVDCDSLGNVDLEDLQRKLAEHGPHVAALMVTYPSTHGVFEERIREICNLTHRAGAQVYMDGANLNAQVGLTSPAAIGADVCHINLHKTFCIPHGGGGPGMGPIAVAKHLAPFLPGHPFANRNTVVGPVAAAPYGSASILVIPWMYLAMSAGEGITSATKVAILNANYVAKRLQKAFPVLYRGATGLVAHECILDIRALKASSGIEAEDVAKRLADYGFHAPTVSFPVSGCLMVEPTESESRAELDRFCEAMLLIRDEIARIERGEWDRLDNPLKNAPHTAQAVIADTWTHRYSREQAAYPHPACRHNKFWPSVGRVDNAYGDRNLVCTCAPTDAY